MRKTCLIFLASLSFLASNLPQAHVKAEDPTIHTVRKWAICIGVSKYDDPKLPVCSTAVNDAKGLAIAIEEHGGFDQMVVFTDDAVEKDPFFPSRRHIQEFLRQLASKIRTDDTVLFSFSGNGCTDETGRAYLLMPDSRMGHLSDTAIPLDEIFDTLRKTGVRRSVVLIDAAREGSESGSSWGVYPDRYLKKGLTAIFYAAAKGYSSHADEKSQYSIFSKSLIQGVQGEADRKYGGNRDGVVTLKELASYVNLALAEWRVQTKGRQVPFIEITDQANADMRVSSAEKVRVAKPRPSGPPVALTSVKKEGSEEKKPAQMEAAKGTAPKEEVKVTFKERTPEQASVAPPVPKIEAPIKEDKLASTTNEEGKSAPEKPSAGFEPQKKKEGPVPIMSQEPARKQVEPEKVANPPIEKRRVVRLRSKPKEISVQELKSLLIAHGFHSTCWNYNGDFCNPKGSFENRFQENGNGTVSDNATGLMWQKGGSTKAMTWSTAREYVEQINRERFAGFSDWRIPTVEELASLIQSSWKNGDLFIDPIFERAQRQCWTLDTKGMDAAWKVNFHQGFLLDFPVDSPSSVRLVRSLQRF